MKKLNKILSIISIVSMILGILYLGEFGTDEGVNYIVLEVDNNEEKKEILSEEINEELISLEAFQSNIMCFVEEGPNCMWNCPVGDVYKMIIDYKHEKDEQFIEDGCTLVFCRPAALVNISCSNEIVHHKHDLKYYRKL